MLTADIPFSRGGRQRRRGKEDDQAITEDLSGMIKKKLPKQDGLWTGETSDVQGMRSVFSGMVLLGCVFEIEDYYLKLSLPGHLFGKVSVAHISDDYAKLLKAFTENLDDGEVSTLKTLFHIGQTLPCKVLSTEASGSDKNHIILSVNPRDVNEALQGASLCHGMHLCCAVHSVEDHGYVMDTGIKNVPGFLSHNSATLYIKDCNGGQNLTVGHLVHCVVNMPSLKKGKHCSGQAVKLTAEPSVVMNCKLSQMNDVALDTFIPGTVVDAVVQKVTEHGLVVDCLGFSGFVCKNHVRCKTGVYKQGQSLQGTVLYSHPVTHILHLTMHPILSIKKVNKMFGGLEKFQIVEKAIVTSVHKSHICLKLKDNVQGIALKSELSDEPIRNIKKKFCVGDIVQCRIKSLHYLDSVVVVSLKESILCQMYMSYDDLTVGEVYEGEVKKLVPGGMVIVLSPGVQGFVRDIYMANVPLTKPEVMFPKGKKVKCKVLSIDNSSSPPTVSLTCKKGMVMTKVPILSSYEEASPGVVSKAVIVNIRDSGLVLSFLNSVQGWVPSSEFGAYEILNPEKVFFKGQVVKCRVMNCYPEEKRLFLTLKIDNTKQFGDKDMSQSKFEVGNIIEVSVEKKTEKGLDVVVRGTKFQAFLPVLHLSDHIENCQSLLECYNEKDVLNVLCFSSKEVPVVTMKYSLVEAAKNGVPCSRISEYKEQGIVPVVVKHFAKYGMFVELGHNITGLVPKKYIADRKISLPEEAGFVPHQTLLGKIHKIEAERNRVELSTKMEDIYNNEYTYGLDLLQSFFYDINQIRHYLPRDNVKSKLAHLSTGSVVSVKVNCITEIGILCVLPNGLKGFATTYHCGTMRMEEGKDLNAVVLFADLINECVELSCLPNILRKVSNLRDINSSKVKVDQVIKGDCVLIKKEFVIMALGGHAVGRFAFIPVRQALNDLTGRGNLFSIGQHYHVILKRIIFGDIAIGVLKQHVRDLNNDGEVIMQKRKNEEKDMQVKKQKISVECSEDSVINMSKRSEPVPCLHVSGYNFAIQSVSDIKRPVDNLYHVSEIVQTQQQNISEKLDDEMHVLEVENFLSAENRTAQTADDFEELLKQFPNSAGHWLRYISFYLEQMEVDKARNVAERALKTISFREEEEKLKVWIVYLNLENLYGSQESMQNVLKRAVQLNDPHKIYSVMLQKNMQEKNKYA